MKKIVFKKKYAQTALLSLAAVVLMAAFAFPIVWSLPFALKGPKEVFHMVVPGERIRWLPTDALWSNFAEVFRVDVNGGTFLRSVGVTLLVAGMSCVAAIFINMLAAYGFARFEFKFKNALWRYILFFMFIPGITIQLTSLKVVSALNMIDTIFALFVPGMANAYNIFFFRQYFLGVPRSIEEAAKMDGAGSLRILLQIFLPMSVTPMVIIGVGGFMGAWNSYIWPTLVITNNQASLSQVSQILFMMKATNARNYGVVIAACFVALVPPLLLFFVFQKKIIEGIAISGLK